MFIFEPYLRYRYGCKDTILSNKQMNTQEPPDQYSLIAALYSSHFCLEYRSDQGEQNDIIVCVHTDQGAHVQVDQGAHVPN